MNNDKYAKYSSGKVTFGSNGAYTSSRVSSGKKSNGCLSMVIFLAVLITGLMFGIKSVSAMGITEGGTNDYVPTHETANPCIPYVHSMVNKGSGFWSHTITLTHGTCGLSVSQFNNGYQDQDDYNSPLPAPLAKPESDKPVNQPKVEHKQKCNNGNGNGAEGCNASDKGNQDETPVKGDKAENHPAK